MNWLEEREPGRGVLFIQVIRQVYKNTWQTTPSGLLQESECWQRPLGNDRDFKYARPSSFTALADVEFAIDIFAKGADKQLAGVGETAGLGLSAAVQEPDSARAKIAEDVTAEQGWVLLASVDIAANDRAIIF